MTVFKFIQKMCLITVEYIFKWIQIALDRKIIYQNLQILSKVYYLCKGAEAVPVNCEVIPNHIQYWASIDMKETFYWSYWATFNGRV